MADDIREKPITWNFIESLASWDTTPVRFRGKPTDIVAALLIGNELGIGPMQSLQSLTIKKGEVSMSTKLSVALIQHAGHRLHVETTAQGTIVTSQRRQDDGEYVKVGVTQYKQIDAERSGLTETAGYKEMPTLAMAWEALAIACQMFFADIMIGLGSEQLIEGLPLDLLESIKGDDIEVLEATQRMKDVLDAEVVST